jgi:hypothetical protein
MAKRQLSQAEIAARQQSVDHGQMVIENVSKQLIQIQLRPPYNKDASKRLDFYVGEQSVGLSPGNSDVFPKNRLYMDQINNLQKRGQLRVRGMKR